MLVLKRKEGQWLEVVHKSGDVLRMRVYHIEVGPHGQGRLDIAFDDAPRNFRIERPERILARSQIRRPIELEYGMPPHVSQPGFDGPIHPMAGGATDLPMSPLA